jgi:hypothetical protein
MISDFLLQSSESIGVISAVCSMTVDPLIGYKINPASVPAFRTRGAGMIYLLDSLTFQGPMDEKDYIASLPTNAALVPRLQLQVTSSQGASSSYYPGVIFTSFMHDYRCRMFYEFPAVQSVDVNFVFSGQLFPSGGFPMSSTVPFSIGATIYCIRDARSVAAIRKHGAITPAAVGATW